MRLPTFLAAALSLPLLVLSKSAKPAPSASSDAIAKFTSLSKSNNGLIPLTDDLYNEITASDRDWSVIVILTALGDQFKCGPCQQFDPELRLAASQHLKKSPSSKTPHFFALLDFSAGQQTFRSLGLNSAPNGRLFLPSSTHPASDPNGLLYDFNRGGGSALAAEALADWTVKQVPGLQPFFKRPPNYAKLASGAFGVVAIVVSMLVAWPVVKAIAGNRYVWACITMPFLLLMIAGQMWNQIRTPPYLTPNQDGTINYFAGGYSNQYGVETQIVAGLYAVLAFSAYTLACTVPKLDDPIRQRAAIYIWSGVLFVMASVLTSVFRLKNGGYPFKMLF